MEHVLLDGDTLTLEEVQAVASGHVRAAVSPEARDRVRRARALVEARLEDGEAHYGINTGFGTLAEVRIPREDLERLQRNLVLSHAAGVGAPLPLPEARALMLLRANVLAKGASGIREETLDLLVAMLDRGVIPVIPERGSVGASGDLAPLAHLALVLVGEGEAFLFGPPRPGAEGAPERLPARGAAARRARAGGPPGEGGARARQRDTGHGGGGDARAPASGAAGEPGRPGGRHDARGAARLAAPVRRARSRRCVASRDRWRRRRGSGRCWPDRELNASHQGPGCHKVQDPYSLRCMPQVHGAARDGVAFCRQVLAREVNAATDNPLVFPGSGEIVSGGNFHGQPVALALDVLAIAASHLAAISERRVEQLVNPSLSGLPPFLAPHPGLNSGFMIAQVTSAALVSENKVLCHPASVDSIPSSAGREDHVSMGMTAALKARQVVENVRTCLAIELLVAAQALDLRAPLRPAPPVADAHARIRARVPHLSEDRALHRDIEAVCRLVDEGALD